MTDSNPSSRHLLLDSVDNIRDLGGLRTHDGRRTRDGLLLRSSMVHDISEADAALLANDFGVRLIIDLRSVGEIERSGRGLLARHIPAYVNLPLFATSEKKAGLLPETNQRSLAQHYIGYLKESAPQIATALRLLAHRTHLPAVFHCAAGKDRTGTLAAVLLGALGVHDEEIIADYALTGERMDHLMARFSGMDHYRQMMENSPAHVRSAQAETMQELLQYFHDQFGGVLPWLQQIGIEEATIAQLRATLLE